MASLLDVLASSNPVSAAVGGVVSVIGKVLDKVIPDPAAKAAAALEIMKLQQSGELAQMTIDANLAQGQMEINKVEAASDGVFKGGWRPFVGWVGGVGLLYSVLLQPLLVWLTPVMHFPSTPPVLDTSVLMTILGGMLGIGGMRTYEKTKK